MLSICWIRPSAIPSGLIGVWAFKQRGLILETMNQTESALVIYDQAFGLAGTTCSARVRR